MQVIATAGHVDHGKSTLVRALTGMEPDRWAEERRRGMTIDLGYAWTTLPTGEEIAFVDVPGHERFTTNMLAGVGPVPAVLLVIAADEGWAAQTDEHVRALDALGVRHGLVAVTRSDLADPIAAMEQARECLSSTTLAGIPAVSVSGATGAGMEALREALGVLARSLPPADPDARVRLWVDRSFTVRGSGTVVTGTLVAGTVRRGDSLALGDSIVSVRGLQRLGQPADVVVAPARVALNLRGVAHDEVRRGNTLLTPGTWRRTGVVDARSHGEKLPSHVVVHIGAAAVPASVRLLDATAGAVSSVVRLTLDTQLPLQVGDRMLLRDPGLRAVVGGVTVLDPSPPSLRRRGAARARAAALASESGVPDVGAEVARRGAVSRAMLASIGVRVIDPPSGVVAAGSWLVAELAVAGVAACPVSCCRGRLDSAARFRRESCRLDPNAPPRGTSAAASACPVVPGTRGRRRAGSATRQRACSADGRWSGCVADRRVAGARAVCGSGTAAARSARAGTARARRGCRGARNPAPPWRDCLAPQRAGACGGSPEDAHATLHTLRCSPGARDDSPRGSTLARASRPHGRDGACGW